MIQNLWNVLLCELLVQKNMQQFQILNKDKIDFRGSYNLKLHLFYLDI